MISAKAFVGIVSVFTSSSTCSLCDIPHTLGSFTAQRPLAYVEPVGNRCGTGTVLSVQGNTTHDDQREFLVNFGLVSNRGAKSRPTPYHDKVVLYTGIRAEQGTGDVWSINPLLTQAPGSGDYNAQGIELDFNNFNAHRGDEDGAAGLPQPFSYGLSITGASSHRSTAAIGVMGAKKMWNRGIVFTAHDVVEQSTFQDLGNPQKSVDIRGQPEFGVYQSNPSSKNYFAGKTGVGAGFDRRAPSATLDVAGDIHFSGQLLHASDKGVKRPAVLGGSTVKRHAILSGTAVLDDRGVAEVRLDSAEAPEFGTERYDVTYSLTAVGAAMRVCALLVPLLGKPNFIYFQPDEMRAESLGCPAGFGTLERKLVCY